MNVCKCPVCEGTGRLYANGKSSPRTNIFALVCHACSGKGFLSVSDEGCSRPLPRVGQWRALRYGEREIGGDV